MLLVLFLCSFKCRWELGEVVLDYAEKHPMAFMKKFRNCTAVKEIGRCFNLFHDPYFLFA